METTASPHWGHSPRVHNIPQETLSAWRRRIGEAWGTVTALRYDIAADKKQQAEDRRAQAEDALRRLALDMERAGADAPQGTVPRNEVPLALLDTPANRRYAAKLREAWEAGMAVDRERYGADIGTDGCAQVIEMVLADVEEECFGAVGAGRE